MALVDRPVLRAGIHRERFPLGEDRETKLNEIWPGARKQFPYYFRLPRDPIALLHWRRYVRHRCIEDLDFRHAIWDACARDVAFWATTFAWIFEPRPLPRRLPFFPTTSQVSLLAWMDETFGVRDMAVNKTRGIGASWCASVFCKHKYYFEPEVAIAIVSEDESKLDSAEGTNPLLGKFQYIHDHMPEWVRIANPLRRMAQDHIYANRRNSALIQGFVSREGKLRGDRFTWMLPDEFAFYKKSEQQEWMTTTQGTVNSRCFISTWNDFDDMFHKILYEEESTLLRTHAFWWNDTERWQGAYKMSKAGTPTIIDKDFKYPPDYPFGEPDCVAAGMLRSPWVDGELSLPGQEDRLKTLRDLYGMSVAEHTNSFFTRDVREAIKASAAVKPPVLEGVLHVNNSKVTIEPTKKSEIRLWAMPDVIQKRGPLTCFCDLGGGAGKAYSVACILDRSGEQVCEYGVNRLDETTFANKVAHLCLWLGAESEPVIDAEANGPFIRPFRAELIRLNYGNIWASQIQDAKARRKKLREGETPDYLGTKNSDGGLKNFREFARAVLEMECVVRSQLVADDAVRCGIDHEKEGRPKFPGNSVHGHGDFIYAAAGAWWRLRSTVDLQARGSDEPQSNVEWKIEDWQKEGHWADQYYRG